MMKYCSNCKKILPIFEKRCPECGTSNLLRFCNQCKKIIPNTLKVCPVCGDIDTTIKDLPEKKNESFYDKQIPDQPFNKLKIIFVILVLVSITFFSCGIYCINEGFDKKDNYYQSEYSYRSNVNVYVGGDAYNYIINGTYFAGYCSLGGALFVCGSIAGACAIFLSKEYKKEQSL